MTGTIAFPSNGTYTFAVSAQYSAELYINDVLIAATIGGAGTHTFTATTAGASPQVERIQIDYEQLAGNPSLKVTWAEGGGTAVVVPGTALSPDYSLTTQTQTDDSSPVTGATVPSEMTTATSYGSSPWLGQVASTTVDPGTGSHLDLVTSATYETSSSLYDRLLTSTKPGGSGTTSTNTYYTATGSIASGLTGSGAPTSSPICGIATSTSQYGMLAYTTSPTPKTGSAIVTAYVYDVIGDVVGQWSTGQTGWTCTTYDSRYRPTQVAYPDRTVTYNYLVGGDPLVSSVSDPSGTITSTVDLDGNTVTSQDALGTVTVNTYNQLGQLTKSAVTPPSGSGQTEQDLGYSYDLDGQVTQETLNSA